MTWKPDLQARMDILRQMEPLFAQLRREVSPFSQHGTERDIARSYVQMRQMHRKLFRLCSKQLDANVITAEMVEAGVEELLSHNVYPDVHFAGPTRETWREAVAAAIKAALAARSSETK